MKYAAVNLVLTGLHKVFIRLLAWMVSSFI